MIYAVKKPFKCAGKYYAPRERVEVGSGTPAAVRAELANRARWRFVVETDEQPALAAVVQEKPSSPVRPMPEQAKKVEQKKQGAKRK